MCQDGSFDMAELQVSEPFAAHHLRSRTVDLAERRAPLGGHPTQPLREYDLLFSLQHQRNNHKSGDDIAEQPVLSYVEFTFSGCVRLGFEFPAKIPINVSKIMI